MSSNRRRTTVRQRTVAGSRLNGNLEHTCALLLIWYTAAAAVQQYNFITKRQRCRIRIRIYINILYSYYTR